MDERTTELLDADEQLRESEQLSRSTVETIADAAIAFDDDGVVLLFSPAAEKMFRYRAGEAIGRNVKALTVPARQSAGTSRRSFPMAGTADSTATLRILCAPPRAEPPGAIATSRDGARMDPPFP
jgi:PAS domain-containing protein